MQSAVAQKPVREKSDSSDSAHVNEVNKEPSSEVGAEAGMPVFLQRVIATATSSPPRMSEQAEDIEAQSRQAADLLDDTADTGVTTEGQQQNEVEQPPEGANTEDLPSEGEPVETDRVDTEDTNQKAQQQQQEQPGNTTTRELASAASNDTDKTDTVPEPTRTSSTEYEANGAGQQTEETQTQQEQTSESPPKQDSDTEGYAHSAGEEGQLELAGHHDAEDTSEAMASENNLLSAPEISLAGDASTQLNRINTNSTVSANLVAIEASTKRQSIAEYFAGKRAAVSGFLDNNVAGVVDFVDQKRASASEWLLSKLIVVQTAAFSLVTRGIAIGTSITSAIRSGVSAIISPLVSGFRAVISRVLSIAQSIPIPDVPGLGRVRRAVSSAARRITSALQSALRNVQNFVQRAVGAVLAVIQNLIARVGAAILNVVTRFLSSIMRVIASINNQLAALKQQILSILRGIRNRVYSLLRRMETAAVAQIDRAELRARARIESNRRQGHVVILQILEFCYDNSDYPADDATHPYMDATDNTASKEEFDSAARAAMNITSEQIAAKNATVVEEFTQETSSVISMFFSDIAAFVNDVWARIRQGLAEFSAAVTQAIADLIQNVSTIVTRIYSGLRGMVASLMSKLRSVVTIIIDVVRVPITALLNITRSAINAVRNFLRGIISSLVNIFSSGSSGNGSPDISSATGALDQFQPSRLAAAARMSSPPLAAGAVLVGLGALIAEAAAATLALIITILFWVAVVLLIIAIIVLIYLLISRALSKPKAIPKARPRVKPRTRNRRRRRRRRRTPLKWNPAFNRATVIASGGVPGILDTTAPLPRVAPIHGHHVWPKYVGGPVAQPLMGIRDTVHLSFVHPTLHAPLAASAAAMGFTIVPSRTNLAFIQHLRGNPGDRTIFAGVLTGYYLGLNAITNPPIPAPAYVLGITHSFPLI